MKEKTRTLLIAGGALVAILAVVVLIPAGRLEKNYPSNLTGEQVDQIEASIRESREAIQQFEEEGDRKPDVFVNEYRILGNQYRLLNQHRQARQAYQAALEHAPNDVGLVAEIYDTYIEAEDYDGLRNWLEAQIDTHPGEFAYWNMLIELERNNFGLEGEELEARYREAVEATDRSLGSLVSLAQYLEYEAQDYAEALELWREAAENNPQYADFYAGQIANLEAKVAGEGA